MTIEKYHPYHGQGTLSHEPKPYSQILHDPVQGLAELGEHHAVSVWVYLQSLPPDWVFNPAHMHKHLKIGRNKFYTILSLLIACNLLQKEVIRDDKGYYVSTSYTVLNGTRFSPEGLKHPFPENRYTDYRDTVNRDYTNKTKKQIKQKATNINICASDDARPVDNFDLSMTESPKDEKIKADIVHLFAEQAFEELWAIYPRKKNKPEAFKEFQKQKLHTKPDLLKRIMDDVRNKALNDYDWQRGFIVYLKKYLANKKWTESIDLRPASPKKETNVERVWRLSTGRTS